MDGYRLPGVHDSVMVKQKACLLPVVVRFSTTTQFASERVKFLKIEPYIQAQRGLLCHGLELVITASIPL